MMATLTISTPLVIRSWSNGQVTVEHTEDPRIAALVALCEELLDNWTGSSRKEDEYRERLAALKGER